jgi:hypothetical protein
LRVHEKVIYFPKVVPVLVFHITATDVIICILAAFGSGTGSAMPFTIQATCLICPDNPALCTRDGAGSFLTRP